MPSETVLASAVAPPAAPIAGEDQKPGPWEVGVPGTPLFNARSAHMTSPVVLVDYDSSAASPAAADHAPTSVMPTELLYTDPDAYRIKPGDVIDIFVWGHDNLATKPRVARDGTVVVRLAGSIRVTGLTVDEAAALIASRLQRFVIQPAVTVTVSEPGGKDVVVVGEVATAGPVTTDRPTRLLDVLIQAKWNPDKADLSIVRVARKDSTITADIASVLRGQRLDQNILLEAGDLVIVPGRELTVSLLGSFTKPGKYTFPVNRSVRVRDLLLEASTWTTQADISTAFVLRSDGKVDPVDVNALWFGGDSRQDRVLKDGDAFVMPEAKEIGVYMLIDRGLSSTAQQAAGGSGGYIRQRAPFTLLQAITLSSAKSIDVRMYDVRVIRGWPNDPRIYKVNVKALLEGDRTQNMMLEQGDVIYVPRTPFSLTIDYLNRLLSPIGGVGNSVRDAFTVQSDVFRPSTDGAVTTTR